MQREHNSFIIRLGLLQNSLSPCNRKNYRAAWILSANLTNVMNDDYISSISRLSYLQGFKIVKLIIHFFFVINDKSCCSWNVTVICQYPNPTFIIYVQCSERNIVSNIFVFWKRFVNIARVSRFKWQFYNFQK